MRDTTPANTDNVYIQRIKYWAAPRCNQILRVLNANWNNTVNGLAVLRSQEYCWQSTAATLYGVRLLSQNCGLSNFIINCVYVTP